ncbi:MAG TPA: 5-dehydro-2-deoxygluconokinase [Caulobacteraceae bacterium]|nr:5-dehydro-2-deoxygluconokinase [Caulobacteraceae bacterium]
MRGPATEPALDLITIGRAIVDLYGEQVGGRLEDMGSFAKYVGGSPTNTAFGAARLGLRSALISRVGKDHFGRFLRETLAREGVDVTQVAEDPARLTGLAFLGIRDAERFPLLFYRRDCADMALAEVDVDDAFVASAAATLISGTHLSTPQVFAASLKAARAAKAAGRKVVFDIDYRPVLWGVAAQDAGENRFVANAAVTARLTEAARLCDLIVGTEEEFQILGGEADPIAALRAVRRETAALLVCKRGALGCVAFPGAVGEGFESGVERAGRAVEVFNVLGAGDAFMAGFLRGWLRGEPLATALDYANACGALVVSRHGCAPAMPTWPELAAFLSGGPWPHRLRESPELEHLHWASTRRPDWPSINALALNADVPAAELDRLLRAWPDVGVMALGEAALGTLFAAAERPAWLARAWSDGADLAQWPLMHVVAARPASLDEATLQRLARACRGTRHELMLEADRVEEMRRAYALGVRPDWWALDAAANLGAAQAALDAGDPLCRGILLTGEVAAALDGDAPPAVKGFIASPADFENAAAAWRAAKGAPVARAAE